MNNNEKKQKHLVLLKLKKGFCRHFYLYFIMILAAAIGTSAYLYQGKNNTASAVLTLNYEEATKGLYPNQTRYSISLIKSKPVLERAIEKGGLKNVDAEDLAANITARGNTIHNIRSGKEGEYRIATSYVITYEKNPEIKRMDAKQVLNLIMQSYKEIFYENYTYSEKDLSYDWTECEKLEYVEVADLFIKESNKIQKYLHSRTAESGTFCSDTTQETFASLKELIDNFINVDLEKYTAYIKQSGLSKNRDRYVNKINFQNYLLKQDYDTYMAEYKNRLKAIDIYDSALTAVVLVPTVDTQQEFYMSRTKVGIDYQAEAAESANSKANDINKQIQENEYIINQVKSISQGEKSKIAEAENMITDMQLKLTNIAEKTELTNRDYVKYKTKNYLSTQIVEKSWHDMLSVKWAIFESGIVFCFICIWILLLDKRKGKV